MKGARALMGMYGDWLLAAAIIGLGEIQAWTAANISPDQKAVTSVMALAFVPMLGFRRRWPLLLLGGVVAATIANFWLPDAGEGEAFGILGIVAAYSAGAYTSGVAAVAAFSLSGALWILITAADPDGIYLGGLIFFGILVFAPLTVGRIIRARRLREVQLEERTVVLELEQVEKAREAVADERQRIARELHDVVAHAISVTVVQARGGRRMLDEDPGEARAAFDAIEHTSTQALREMRRLLGMLRETDDELALAPLPSLGRLDALADRVRAAGLPVEIAIEGEPVELPPGVDLSAYRIVQEALTNALKHAGPARAHVRVRYAPDQLELEITDDGAGTGDGGGSGQGLVGMRERVAVFGGDLQAGRISDGGYALRARLPIASARA